MAVYFIATVHEAVCTKAEAEQIAFWLNHYENACYWVQAETEL